MESQPEVTELNQEELELYLKLQKKVGWKRSGQAVFESFFPILPVTCSEQAVVRYIDKVPHVLMWYRKDEHYEGWHMPGGYILKGESEWEWTSRVLSKEVGLELKRVEFIRWLNHRAEHWGLPNHQLACLFLCEAEGEVNKGKFFPLTDLPADTMAHHCRMIQHVRAHLIRKETMHKEGIYQDDMDKAQEGKWLVVTLDSVDLWQNIVCDSLDEAVGFFIRNKASGRGVFLLDDEGKQIM